MTYKTLPPVSLKTAPELLAVIRAASPSYRKHNARVVITDSVELNGTYWSGGSRSTYTAVNLATMETGRAAQYAPPQFGGPAQSLRVAIPMGVVIVETGIFCGKAATACVYMHPANVQALLVGC
jgi:hypothetical protein